MDTQIQHTDSPKKDEDIQPFKKIQELNICPACRKSFSSKGNLKSHFVTFHQGIYLFPCTFPGCDRKFSCKSRLEIHMRSHLGIKPFQCPICLKCFNEKGNLKTHVKFHSTQRPFQCAKCEKTYKSNCHLKAHFKAIHQRSEVYRCKFCKKDFGRFFSLQSHLKSKHFYYEKVTSAETKVYLDNENENNDSPIMTPNNPIPQIVETNIKSQPIPLIQPIVQPVIKPLIQPVIQPIIQPVLQPLIQPLVQPMVNKMSAFQGIPAKVPTQVIIHSDETTEVPQQTNNINLHLPPTPNINWQNNILINNNNQVNVPNSKQIVYSKLVVYLDDNDKNRINIKSIDNNLQNKIMIKEIKTDSLILSENKPKTNVIDEKGNIVQMNYFIGNPTSN